MVRGSVCSHAWSSVHRASPCACWTSARARVCWASLFLDAFPAAAAVGLDGRSRCARSRRGEWQRTASASSSSWATSWRASCRGGGRSVRRGVVARRSTTCLPWQATPVRRDLQRPGAGRRFLQPGRRPTRRRGAARDLPRRWRSPTALSTGRRAGAAERPLLRDARQQLDFLRAAGFRLVDCFWKCLDLVLIGGYK